MEKMEESPYALQQLVQRFRVLRLLLLLRILVQRKLAGGEGEFMCNGLVIC